jgi:hypothetical protein
MAWRMAGVGRVTVSLRKSTSDDSSLADLGGFSGLNPKYIAPPVNQIAG